MTADTSTAAELARLSAAVAAQDEAIVTALVLATAALEDGYGQLAGLAKMAEVPSTPALSTAHLPDPQLVRAHLQQLYGQAAQRRRAQDLMDARNALRHQPNETQ